MSFDQDPNEQANISGADLAILIEELAAESKNKQEFERDWLECCDKLAASQARENVLRDALGFLANNLGEYAGAMQTQQQADVLTNYAEAAFAALTLPADDTALNNICEIAERRELECQAREKVLRDQMRRIIGLHVAPEQCYSTGPLHGDWRDESCPSCEGLDLLAQPTDDTALKAALKAERERCAKVCDGWIYSNGPLCATAIRALGDGQ